VHRGVFANPKLEVIVGDGLEYLKQTDQKFDLVLLDLPDPIGPAEMLYEEPFFADCKRVLSPGGALSLHMGSPWGQPERVRAIYGRLAKLFRVVRPYTMFIPLYGNLWAMAVCSDSVDPAALAPAEVEKRIVARRLEHLQYYNGGTHAAVFALPNFVRELTVGSQRKPALRKVG
jgi:spermidine synthase